MGQPNPFFIAGPIVLHKGEPARGPGWYYHDETGDWTGPFKSEKRALKELLGYAHWLEHGPTHWQRIWWPVKWGAKDAWKLIVRFWRDTSSGGRYDTRRSRQGEGEKGPGGPSAVL